MFIRRALYGSCMLFSVALVAIGAGTSLHDDTLHVKRPERAIASGSHWPVHCGIVAASIPEFLKTHRLEKIGEEFLEVNGVMLVKRKFPAEVTESFREQIVTDFHRSRHNAKAKNLVLNPEVCDEFVDVAGVTDRRACEFVFMVKGCGLLDELEALEVQIATSLAQR